MVEQVEELPEDWIAAFDDNYNCTYYFDKRTRRSTWTKPKLYKLQQEMKQAPQANYESSVSTSADEETEAAGYYRRSAVKVNAAVVGPSAESTPAPVPSAQDNAWVELYSKAHERKYFYNTVTKESVWKDPQLKKSSSLSSPMEESNDHVLRDIPALQNAWDQIEKAREEIKREREEVSSRLRTDAKILKAHLEEFNRLRKEYAFTPKDAPNESMEEPEKEGDVSEDEEEDLLDSLGSELNKYSIDIEKRTAKLAESADKNAKEEAESESDEDIDPTDVAALKARHRKKMAKRRKERGPDSMVMFMDVEEEIKGVVEEMKAREQAKKEAALIPEGDYYKVLGVKKDATGGQLKRAYHKLMIMWHPDKNPDNLEEATQKSNIVTDAYTVLSDAWEREIYDWLGLEKYLIHAKTVQAFKNYMWSGIKVKKHGRNGKRYGLKGIVTFYPAKRRYLWLDFHCKSMNSGPKRILEAQTDKERDSIKSVDMDAISDIKKGMSTEVFQRTGVYSRSSHYFSIVSPERSLDIEAESREQRDFLSTRISLLVFDLQKNKEKLQSHYKAHPIKSKKKPVRRKRRARKRSTSS